MVRKSLLAVAAMICAAPLAAQQGDALPNLGRQQYVAQMDAEFARLDVNGDGQVVAAEIVASQQQAAKAEALRQNRAVFDGLDRNGNGMLSPEEFGQLANPDAIPTDAAPLLSRFDSNSDGIITLVEYRIATQASFDRIDGDRDGTITPLELRAAGLAQ